MRRVSQLKKNKNFYLAVEGQNEELYFNHIQKLLNETVGSEYRIVFKIKVKERPPINCVKWASSQSGLSTCQRYAIFDYEDDNHIDENLQAIDESRENNKVECIITNLTFEVWMILHKIDFRTCLNYRNQYLSCINDAFNKSYLSLSDFKNELEFKRILESITLSDVKDAYIRAKALNADTNKVKKINHKKVVVLENPDTNITGLIGYLLKTQGVIDRL